MKHKNLRLKQVKGLIGSDEKRVMTRSSRVPYLLVSLVVVGIVIVGLGACGTKHSALLTLPFSPSDVAVDNQGNVYIADAGRDVVEKITPAGTLSIAAGNGWPAPPIPGPAVKSPLYMPSGIAIDSHGDLFIADASNGVVEKVTPSGMLSIVAGGGDGNTLGPGLATKSFLGEPSGVAVDRDGDLYIADMDNDAVAKVTPSGMLSIVAGGSQGNTPIPGPAIKSPLAGPSGVAVDSQGNLYIADAFSNMVVKVSPAGVLSIVTGNGKEGAPTSGLAIKTLLNRPKGVAVDGHGNIFIADSGNSVVEKVSSSGVLSIAAGNGRAGSPTPGLATHSSLNAPSGVTIDDRGNLYIADQGNRAVEKVTPSGILSVLVDQGPTVGTPQVVTK